MVFSTDQEETTKMKFHGGKEEDFVLRKKPRSDGSKASHGKRSAAVAKQEDVKIDSLGTEVAKADEYAFDSSDEEVCDIYEIILECVECSCYMPPQKHKLLFVLELSMPQKINFNNLRGISNVLAAQVKM